MVPSTSYPSHSPVLLFSFKKLLKELRFKEKEIKRFISLRLSRNLVEQGSLWVPLLKGDIFSCFLSRVSQRISLHFPPEAGSEQKPPFVVGAGEQPHLLTPA